MITTQTLNEVFTTLAQRPDARSREFASLIWTKAGVEDSVTAKEIGCDESLIALGLARKNSRKRMVYATRNGKLRGPSN